MRILLNILYLLMPFLAYSQSNPVFHSPLEIPLVVSGTFGEPRADHFHAGIDFTTKLKENIKVYSIESGWVSRIKISAINYGKAIYVTHPNGYVSVYAHMNKFSPKIEKKLMEEHYRLRSFEIDVNIPDSLLWLNRGELIGYSGNTGSSSGPHLHFEIRNAENQWPLNPLSFGFAITDTSPPVLEFLKVYPHGTSSRVNGSHEAVTLPIIRKNGGYSLRNGDTLRIKGSFSFGLMAYDEVNNQDSRCGVYSVKIILQEREVFRHAMDILHFDKYFQYRSFIDFAENRRTTRRFMRSRVLPGNTDVIYCLKENEGVYSIKTGETISAAISAAISAFDYAGNSSSMKLIIVSDTMSYPFMESSCPPNLRILYDQAFYYCEPDIELNMPAITLFETSCFYFGRRNEKGRFVSPVYTIGNADIPVINRFELKIRTSPQLPESLTEKLVLVELKNALPVPREGSYAHGHYTALVRSFGDYALMLDTIAPELKVIGVKSGVVYTKSPSVLRFLLSDNLSGISSYNAYLNDEWVLLEYDAKTKTLSYYPANILERGGYTLRIEAGDKCGNKTELVTRFYIK